MRLESVTSEREEEERVAFLVAQSGLTDSHIALKHITTKDFTGHPIDSPEHKAIEDARRGLAELEAERVERDEAQGGV